MESFIYEKYEQNRMETQYSTKPAGAYRQPTSELRQMIRSAAHVETTSEERAEELWIKILAEIEKIQTITPPAASSTVQQ